MAQEIETAGRGPDPGAVRLGRQPGAVGPRRRRARARAGRARPAACRSTSTSTRPTATPTTCCPPRPSTSATTCRSRCSAFFTHAVHPVHRRRGRAAAGEAREEWEIIDAISPAHRRRALQRPGAAAAGASWACGSRPRRLLDLLLRTGPAATCSACAARASACASCAATRTAWCSASRSRPACWPEAAERRQGRPAVPARDRRRDRASARGERARPAVPAAADRPARAALAQLLDAQRAAAHARRPRACAARPPRRRGRARARGRRPARGCESESGAVGAGGAHRRHDAGHGRAAARLGSPRGWRLANEHGGRERQPARRLAAGRPRAAGRDGVPERHPGAGEPSPAAPSRRRALGRRGRQEGSTHEHPRAPVAALDLEPAPSSSARSRMLARPRCPGSDGASGSSPSNPSSVVGHTQLELGAQGAQRDRHRVCAGVPACVDHRLLDDAEQVPGRLGGQVEALDGQEHLEAVAAPPDRHAALDRGLEAQLIERVRAEVDQLVAQHLDAVRGQLARLVDQSFRPRRGALLRPRPGPRPGPCPGRSAPAPGRREGPGPPSPNLVLGLQRAPREAPRPQTGGRLRRAQAAHHQRGGDGGDHEDRLVERQDRARDGRASRSTDPSTRAREEPSARTTPRPRPGSGHDRRSGRAR